MKFLNFKFLSLLSLMFLLIVSCSNDDNNGVTPAPPMAPEAPTPEPPTPEEGTTIADVAIATPELESLVAALQEADLVGTLEGDGPFTVFAPTNEAFATFLSDGGFASVADVPDEVLSQVLLNHVITGSALESSALTTTYVSSSSTAGVDGKALSLFVDISDGVKINGSTVTSADVEASNGVVHIVDQVIGLPNIVNHALNNPALSELVGALTAGDNITFTDLLSSEETAFTVFAPVNDGFAAFENPDDNDINNILSNHVIAGSALAAADLSNSYANTAAVNEDGDNLSIYVNTDDGVTLNGESTVAIADIVATNGIIHAVDLVIDLPTVVDFAVADSANFSALVGALTAEGQPDFVATLSTPWGTAPAPFTVFAPLNSAFEALEAVPEGDALTAVLQHHVIAGANVVSGDLVNGLTAATLEGDEITFVTSADTFTITDGSGNAGVNIAVTNVQAINGVIHAIDTVLIPDTTN